MNYEKEWTESCNPDVRSDLFAYVNKLHEDKDYSKFRKSPAICINISGNNLRNRGDKYFAYLCKNNKNIIYNNIQILHECDRMGDPYLYKFKSNNNELICSDSVLPPLFVIQKLIETFKQPLQSNLNIFEIGCGFGINTKIFSDIVKFESYTHIDVPVMLKLQKTYLDNFGVKNVTYINPYTDMDNIKDKYDLLISDFAYTEFSDDLKKHYFDNIIQKVDKGIILGNMSPDKIITTKNCLTKKDFNLFEQKFYIKYEINNVYGKGGILFFSKKQF